MTGPMDKLGRPLADLRISVTDRCNFRCPYCMPAEVYGERYKFLPRSQVLTYEETARLARLFVSLGVSKVRLTGGEPLVRQGVEKLVEMLAATEGIKDLTLTTNGYLLAQKAQALKHAGLGRVTVSLDSLDPGVFRTMSGVEHGPEAVLNGIDKAREVGLSPIKINAVVKRGVNDHTVLDLARRFKGTGAVVRFIEYMDVGNLNGWDRSQVVTASEIVDLINAEFPLVPVDKGYRGEVAERYRYLDGDGEIGVIASVSKPFCGNCTRARLSTDGKLYTCLFAGQGRDLRGPLLEGATDAQLLELISGVWRARTDRYSQDRAAQSGPSPQKIEMYQIGG
jgi:cyclic pyranopterin phosphate synthase